MDENNMNNTVGSMKQVPAGVKVISVLHYILAGILAISGVLVIAGGGLIGAFLGTLISSIGTLGSALFVVMGIVILGFGVLNIFLGIGLWKGKKWARLVVIVFSAIGIVLYVISLISQINVMNIISLGLDVFFFAYLTFSKKVKEAFR
jgi:hypothetical protein